MRKKSQNKEQKDAENRARQLFHAGKLADVCRFSQAALDLYPKSIELWKIFGAALGGLGRSKEARRAFLVALELVPNDPTAIANYITSCFHDADVKSAIAAIELYFDELPNETQSVVLNSLAESIHSGMVSEKQLPPVILSLFENENEVLSDLEVDPVAGPEGGQYEFNKQEIREIVASITAIQRVCEKAKRAVKQGKLSVKEAEDIYVFVEDKLVEIAVILDGALE